MSEEELLDLLSRATLPPYLSDDPRPHYGPLGVSVGDGRTNASLFIGDGLIRVYLADRIGGAITTIDESLCDPASLDRLRLRISRWLHRQQVLNPR